MPTYKNIRVPVGKSGKTRLQRVQVLASGKYKFVKNIKRVASRTSPKKRTGKKSSSAGRRNVSKGKLFGSISGIGALEDLAVGLGAGAVLRAMGAGVNAVPTVRILQGFAGHAMNRRGKRHLIDGLLDYIDNVLLDMIGMGVGVGRSTRRIGLKFPKLQL